MTLQYTIDQTILGEALAFSRGKSSYNVSSDLLESLIRRIADKKERLVFHEALRYALNELSIYDTNGNGKREAYRSAAGKYFSMKSALVRRARAERGVKKTQKPKPERRPVDVTTDSTGQYAFVI